MGTRRKGREIALQLLYEIDSSHKTLQEILSEKLHLRFPYDEEVPALDEQERILEFAQSLLKGVKENQDKIDETIERYSTHWKISRMAIVDRNILRIATYEMQYCPDVPISVSINEAIDLAKTFGSEDSSSFINGVLDHIAKVLREVPKFS
ncbi:MAG: transcription antitermination factor NusB [Deltaproteobacteria bacterium]|nr:transcription antitermination factor NusB [Deltaproteobacteria bacterium]